MNVPLRPPQFDSRSAEPARSVTALGDVLLESDEGAGADEVSLAADDLAILDDEVVVRGRGLAVRVSGDVDVRLDDLGGLRELRQRLTGAGAMPEVEDIFLVADEVDNHRGGRNVWGAELLSDV